MSQTLRQMRALSQPRRMTVAGKCWIGYFAVLGLIVWWLA